MKQSEDGVRGSGVRVVFAGDSITASASWDAILPGVQTVNVAVPGFTTADLRSQLPGITALAPDVLVLLIGTNDLGGLDQSPDDVADDITTIIENLMRDLPGTRIVLNSLMPRDPYWTPSITRINARLAGLAAEQPVTYVDTWSALALPDGTGLDPRYLLLDGFDVHLNHLGYQAWQRILEPAVSPYTRDPLRALDGAETSTRPAATTQ
jgi:N-acetylglucosamine-6-sulfatase